MQKVADSPFHVVSASGQKASTLLDRKHELEVPTRCMYLWEWYWELARSRSSGMSGPEAITYAELNAWELRKGYRIHDWETDVLFKLDRIQRTPADKGKDSK